MILDPNTPCQLVMEEYIFASQVETDEPPQTEVPIILEEAEEISE